MLFLLLFPMMWFFLGLTGFPVKFSQQFLHDLGFTVDGMSVQVHWKFTIALKAELSQGTSAWQFSGNFFYSLGGNKEERGAEKSLTL